MSRGGGKGRHQARRRKSYAPRQAEVRWRCPVCQTGFTTFEARNLHYLRRHTPVGLVVPR